MAEVGKVIKNEIPIYEIISGAALAFSAILLILPGFATDCLGLLIIFHFMKVMIHLIFIINMTLLGITIHPF